MHEICKWCLTARTCSEERAIYLTIWFQQLRIRFRGQSLVSVLTIVKNCTGLDFAKIVLKLFI